MKTFASLPLLISIAALTSAACGSTVAAAPAVPPCDQACHDGIALRAMREGMKLAFNLTLQGRPVGPQDVTLPCPLGGGTAHVFGEATSNAVQGATFVHLTYVLDHCGYAQQDTDPKQTYHVTVTGTLKEDGTLAVQPSSTNALTISSDSVTVTGSIGDPPIEINLSACALQLGQNGNNLAGTMCGRDAGVTL